MIGHPITAEEERLAQVLDHARLRLFTGGIEDEQALNRAEALDLVERVYEGAAGFIGLSKLELTEAGKAWLEERQ